MISRAYYNEIDPYAAQWLRNLISAGHIAPGEVDTRSIEDVTAGDLVGFTQCHFFAGIGGWSAALRLAGWPDDRAVWTGSCPCQPFSQAGKGAGTADERHLWPAWFHLINECRPAVVFGEQVEAAIAHGWLDLVQDDLEGIDYAFAPVGVPAASVGAPHIRHRLWWVADAVQPGRAERWSGAGVGSVAGSGVLGSLANNNNNRRDSETTPGLHNEKHHAEPRGDVGDPLAGFWSDADWIACRDGKARPVEPGTFPLAPRLPNHVGRLRAYGNAIVPEVAAEVIGAYLDGVA